MEVTTKHQAVQILDQQANRFRHLSVATRVIRAQTRTTMIAVLVIVASIISAVCMGSWIVYSRPTHVSVQSGGSVLVDKSGEPIETGVALHDVDLVSLAEEGDLNKLDRLRSVRVPDLEMATQEIHALVEAGVTTVLAGHDVPIRMVSIGAWSYSSASSRLVVRGVDGTTVLVSNGNMQVKGPSNGHASFDAGGVGWTTNANTNLTALAGECADYGCPLSACAAHTWGGELLEMTCGGTAMWRWPTGVDLPAPITDRRRAGSCWQGCMSAYAKCLKKMQAQVLDALLSDCASDVADCLIDCAVDAIGVGVQ